MSKLQQHIFYKLSQNEPISEAEAYQLYDLDVFTLGQMAKAIKVKKYGNKIFFNVNRHLNPTNVCKDTCKFCGYAANRKQKKSWTMTAEQILAEVDDAVSKGALEIHIVSAHNPNVPLGYYFDNIAKIKAKYPHVHIKSLTAAEVDFIAKHFKMSYKQVLEKMQEAGVDSMPGGGAEIFDEKVRKKICHGKVSSSEWLEIHKLWHEMGRQSNVTMLFGHIESKEHRIDHMLRVRTLQEQSNGFNAFIPLVYQRHNNYLKVKKFPNGEEILKTMAIARIILHNVPHIKAYWATATMNLALLACEFGADDLDGTIQKESIQSASGAASSNGKSFDEFIDLITDAGFTPVQRDSLYNELEIYA